MTVRRDIETRADVHDLVVRFYREIVFDELLEPVFGEIAEVDWAEHIPLLIDYWSQVLLGDRGYRGALLAAHQHLHELAPLRPEMFDRWYRLFATSVDGGWAGPRAETAKRHAARIADSMARRILGIEWQVPHIDATVG